MSMLFMSNRHNIVHTFSVRNVYLKIKFVHGHKKKKKKKVNTSIADHQGCFRGSVGGNTPKVDNWDF